MLPLLEAETVARGWLSQDAFLAGYGAAQVVPGLRFTFGAYLGAVLGPEPNGTAGAILALFLPGFFALIGVLPFRDAFGRRPWAQSAMQGANAAYAPVFTIAIDDLRDFSLAPACFVLLTAWRAAPWFVVVAAAGGAALAMTR